MAQRFTSGKFAKAYCDRCGDKIKYTALIKEWTGLLVCSYCLDPKTALEFPTNFPSDAEAIRNPRPNIDVEASNGRVLIGSDDLGSTFIIPAMVIELGNVTVTVG